MFAGSGSRRMVQGFRATSLLFLCTLEQNALKLSGHYSLSITRKAGLIGFLIYNIKVMAYNFDIQIPI